MIYRELDLQSIIERALVMITTSEYFQNPPFFDKDGNRINITKVRDFDGFDDNQEGITLSIFPYAYEGTSNETVTSNNVAMSWEPLEVGSRGSSTGGRERLQVRLLVTLQTIGFRQDATSGPTEPNRNIIYERSEKEAILRKYLMYIWSILLRKPIFNLGGLIHTSTVHFASLRTAKWDKKENAVLHKAAILWNLELYTRNEGQLVYQNLPNPNNPEEYLPTWTYIGVRNIDEMLCYWDSQVKKIVTSSGVPLLQTPKNIAVVWDPSDLRFETLTGTPLTTTQLEDPNTTPPNKPWIDTNLLIVGVLTGRNLYYNKLFGYLQFFDGTVVTQLPDGTPIYYDPDTDTVNNGNTNQPIDLPSSGFIPLKHGKVSIFDAANLELRETFLF
jgi:hypothetical protein